MADPYSLLGIPRTADDAAIKSAYRKLAKELHPDKNKDNPKAADRFSEVTAAYDLLSDKDKRAQFDRGEIDGSGNPTNPFGGGFGGGGGFRQGPGGFETGGNDFGDIFEGLFGGGRRGGGTGGFTGFGARAQPPRQGDNVQYRLRVGFIDAATRAPQRITLQDGKTLDLKLPAGVESGMQMRLSGKGERGPGGAGDAIVTIEIDNHPFFKRDGDDVRVDVPITLDEAVNGARIKVPTVDGPVILAVAAGARSGQSLRLKERGFTRKDGTRGAQYVTLMIDLPADDERLKAFVADWTDTRAVRGDLGV
ncbi:DnaJ domain-containing protein [Sphingobium sufflavum]|uniref:DnaJ C-terminal domain-containing protein n=1 Tax=Sphingobium sufflavum TaxID=1129547 RepID=UPI001F309CF9|nr:DnaJ C-terminal domain-containing protein [Sphingobium sufflavum]MCE7795600.1 DnaJ domain-containing protein [Sphingobium sufflavum]